MEEVREILNKGSGRNKEDDKNWCYEVVDCGSVVGPDFYL